MSALVPAARRRSPSERRSRRDGVAPVSIVAACLGCALLAVRPALLSSVPHPTAVLVLMLAALLVVGLVAPLPSSEHDGRAATKTLGTVPAVCAGVAVFTVARMATGGDALGPATIVAILGNTLAAVAEEVWFRRFVYGLLEPGGAVFAVAGSAALFAAVHVTTYGWWVLPLDVAAGLVLGWQRAATRSWHASAITHVFANLLVLL
jgi:membrane protease YdiL (CAAX protease family)